MGDLADLAHYYFENDTEYNVVAFTVDRNYCDRESHLALPVVPFDEIAARFPPENNSLFIALGYGGLNEVRQRKFGEGQSLGYQAASYISPRASILNQGRIGKNCFILEDNTIQPFVEIGDNVVLWSGNHIGHHSRIESHCFLASHVVISGRVTVGERCFIGVNATVRDNITIGPRCVIGAGSLVLADIEAEGVYSPDATPRSRVPSSRLRRI